MTSEPPEPQARQGRPVRRETRDRPVPRVLLAPPVPLASLGRQEPKGLPAQGATGPTGPEGSQAATTNGSYAESSLITDLKSASGLVFDRAHTSDTAGGERDWMISGVWTLECQTACLDAQPSEIKYDMSFAMFLDPNSGDPGAKGDNSHGHQFSNFVATATPTEDSGALTILGTINGSGPLGGPITITLKRHATSDPQHFTFSFELTDHSDANIITHAINGVVVESMDN